MLNQKRSGSLTRLKYLVAAPICGALLCASTLGFSKNYGWVDLAPGRTSIHANVAEPGSATGTRIVKTTDVQVTSKGYKYHETGYLMNGKTNYRVIITEKNGDQKAYFKNTVTAAEIKLLKDKYGYKFPDMQLFSKLPTQPPAAPAGPEDPAKINEKLAPPPPGAPVSPSKVGEKLAPPPPVQPKPVTIADVPLVSPSGNSFDSLYKYIAKYTRYPAKARTNLVSGRLFVRFTVKDGKIADVKIARPLDPEIDGEVLRVIKNFDGALDPALSNCSLPVLFTIFDSQGKPLRNTLPAADDKKAITIRDTPADAAKVDHSKLYMLNEVVVATYL